MINLALATVFTGWQSQPVKKSYFCNPMKLFDTLLVTLGVVFLVVGIYEAVSAGIAQAYGPLMLALLIIFWFTYRKISKA